MVSRRKARRSREAKRSSPASITGKIMVTFDRGDCRQCAYVIPKGGWQVKAKGLPALLDDIVRMAPLLKSGISDVKSRDDMKLLTVAINRLDKWAQPRLLCIGDAAHAMSPMGEVGVNLAVQDAVATTEPSRGEAAAGRPDEADACRGATQREFPVRMTQRTQVVGQDKYHRDGAEAGHRAEGAAAAADHHRHPLAARDHTARFLGLGVRPEHVRSPIDRS